MKRIFTLVTLISSIAYCTCQAQSIMKNAKTGLHPKAVAKFIEVDRTQNSFHEFGKKAIITFFFLQPFTGAVDNLYPEFSTYRADSCGITLR